MSSNSVHTTEAAPGSQRKSEEIVQPFSKTLADRDLKLTRAEATTLQLNVGLQCNQMCRHCHLEAGPHRTEMMSRETVDSVLAYAHRCRFKVVDITGGAPELNPHLTYLIEQLTPLTDTIMLRSNLTAIAEPETEKLADVCKAARVVIVASFPSVSATQTDAQRGSGIWDRSVSTLRRLNDLGFGKEDTGLQLHLVSNPAGAFLPEAQTQAEKRFKRELERKHGIVFNQLFTFANVPLGRFRTWLESSGNLSGYLEKLAARFNPCTLDGLMCRSLVSVDWDGHLYDCDFNLAVGIYCGGRKRHVTEMAGPPEEGSQIMTGDHCYACTAGSGFT